ncbi:MAG: hypothetical protein SXV54_08505 [Chloroflexota bacterium]|nr:hypothetical protein [Chloroflexota bacterium]
MKTGLLWFDDDPRKQLEEKVQRAASHYERKYGRLPTLCFVHPSVFSDNGKHPVKKVSGVEVRAGHSVLPDHFWLGVGEDKSRVASRR